MKPCRVGGCDRRVRREGLCFGHVRRGEDADIAPRFPALVRDAAGRKRCRACEQWLELDDFTQDFRAKDGRRSICLACHSLRRRMAKFGVAADWFSQTLDAQGGCCAICRSPEPRGRGWAIDHDHQCCSQGATSCGDCVRGILCNPCNLALGMVGDSVDVLNAAVTYLTTHSRLSIEPERMSIVRGV